MTPHRLRSRPAPAHRSSRRFALGSALVLPALVVAALCSPTLAGPAAAATPSGAPFGRLVCGPKDGVTFCQGGLVGGQDRRVPSFDGVPIDADLTLPTTGKAPYP